MKYYLLTNTFDSEKSLTKSFLLNTCFIGTNIGSSKLLSKYLGKLHNRRIYLQDITVKKILNINHFPLPCDIISIIKDNLFYSGDYILHRTIVYVLKYEIELLQFDRFVIRGDDDHIDYDSEVCISNIDTLHLHFNMCLNCGNYSSANFYGIQNDKILCYCENHPYYQNIRHSQSFHSYQIKEQYNEYNDYNDYDNYNDL